jgi:putative ABC transport system permease protein
LARLGYFTQEEVLEIVNKALNENDEYNEALYKNKFTYEELMGKEFTWYPNDTVFTEGKSMFPGMPAPYVYNSVADGFSNDGKLDLKIVGILTPKDSVSYGSLSSGIYYTEALTNHVLETNSESNFENYLRSEASAMLAMMAYNIEYEYTYSYDSGDGDLTPKTAKAMIGPELSMQEMMAFYMAGDDPVKLQEVIKNLDKEDMINRFSRLVGGNNVASSVTIYPLSFDEKNFVTDYLDKWNAEGDLVYTDKDGNTVTVKDRESITYTDALELVINLINTMIDVVSYALIAFTSVSLVVSTVMIGIITYVSVVERIKEIGVIRSLGGRKKDVSHLFNAETFIIGLLAGLIGVGFTYVVSIVVNLILEPLINYARIAALPVSNALILIALSILLTCISGLIPAKSAANKDPVVALRTE